MKRCIVHLTGFIALFLIEILIGTLASGWIRGYLGDVLVLPVLYCLIRIFTAKFPRTLPLWLFGLGCVTELLQLVHFAALLGFPQGSLPAILIGTNADWMDILCYALGTCGIYIGICIARYFQKQKGDSHGTAA